MIGNAVRLANTTGTINIVSWDQYGDPSTVFGEPVSTRRAITRALTAASRTATFTNLSRTLTSADLATAHVLLIPEMEEAGIRDVDRAATAMRAIIRTFVDGGGVVIGCDISWDGSEPLRTIRMLTQLGYVTGFSSARRWVRRSLYVHAGSSPIADGVSRYIAGDATVYYTGIRGVGGTSTNVITVDAAGTGAPVVLHIEY